jgi:predicted dehydrogenase
MKLAILGTENSHAFAFAKFINTDPDFSDMELVGVYGYDAVSNDRLVRAGYVQRVANDPHEFLGQVDGVLVTARHGDHHWEYALPYVKSGAAAFIDKPFTVKEAYARELISEAEKSGALLCGGSCLKFLRDLGPIREFAQQNNIVGGYVGAPINMVNDYAGFFFYSQHLLEMMLTVFGFDIKAVTAYCPDESKNRVSAIFDYGEFDVLAQYTSSYRYTITAYGDKACQSAYTHDLGDCFKQELLEFKNMVLSGQRPHAYKDLLKPVLILNAIHESYRTGKKVEIPAE